MKVAEYCTLLVRCVLQLTCTNLYLLNYSTLNMKFSPVFIQLPTIYPVHTTRLQAFRATDEHVLKVRMWSFSTR